MRVVAVAVLTLSLAAAAGAEDPPHAPRPGIAQPKIQEGWTVLVCSVFSTATSISISAGPDDKSLEPIGEWTAENKGTKWVLPAKIAEAEKVSVQLKAAPADKKGSACLMYRRVPRHRFDFSGEAAAAATQNDPFVPCPCARGYSLDEQR